MKSRSREVNIFNMSLLDILCGALGAFCFMMLVLMPYYKPPKEQVDIQKKQQEIQDELKKLAEMKDKISDAQMARDLEELVKKLQAQVNELQGRLNYTLAENERLKEELERLKRERDQALAENQQLRGENQQLKAEIQPLRDENQKLRADNQQLQARNQQLQTENDRRRQENNQLRQEKAQLQAENRALSLRLPFLVKAVAVDAAQDVGLYVQDPAIYKDKEGKDSSAQPSFDPKQMRQGPTFPGDIATWVPSRGVAAWVIRDLPPNTRLKVYASLANPPDKTAATLVHVDAKQFGFGAMNFPDFELTLDHPWVYVGDILGNPGQALIARTATPEERQKEWAQVGSVGHSDRPPPPPPPPPSPEPTFGRGGPSANQGRRRAAENEAEILAIKARLTFLKTHPPTDRKGAEENQLEIAKLEEKLKVLIGPRETPAPSPAPAVRDR